MTLIPDATKAFNSRSLTNSQTNNNIAPPQKKFIVILNDLGLWENMFSNNNLQKGYYHAFTIFFLVKCQVR